MVSLLLKKAPNSAKGCDRKDYKIEISHAKKKYINISQGNLRLVKGSEFYLNLKAFCSVQNYF